MILTSSIELFDNIIPFIKAEFRSTSFNNIVSSFGSSHPKREIGVQFILQNIFENYKLNSNQSCYINPEYEIKSINRKIDFLLGESDDNFNRTNEYYNYLYNRFFIELKYINKESTIKKQISNLNSQLCDIKNLDETSIGMLFYTGEINTNFKNISKRKKDLNEELKKYRKKVNEYLNINYFLHNNFEIRYNYNGKLSYICIDFVFEKKDYYMFTDNDYINLGLDNYSEDFHSTLDSLSCVNDVVEIEGNYYCNISDFRSFLIKNYNTLPWELIDAASYISLRKNNNNLSNIIAKIKEKIT